MSGGCGGITTKALREGPQPLLGDGGDDSIRENGKLIGFATITRDMTAQRNDHLAVLVSERKIRLLVRLGAYGFRLMSKMSWKKR
jgi:hypothetical protein